MVCDRKAPETDKYIVWHSGILKAIGHTDQTRYTFVRYAVYDLPVAVEQIFRQCPIH